MRVNHTIQDKSKLLQVVFASSYGEKGICQIEAGNQAPETILTDLVKTLHLGQKLQLESLPD